MGRFYGIKIRSGIMTIDQVHVKWRTATEQWLAENP